MDSKFIWWIPLFSCPGKVTDVTKPRSEIRIYLLSSETMDSREKDRALIIFFLYNCNDLIVLGLLISLISLEELGIFSGVRVLAFFNTF